MNKTDLGYTGEGSPCGILTYLLSRNHKRMNLARKKIIRMLRNYSDYHLEKTQIVHSIAFQGWVLVHEQTFSPHSRVLVQETDVCAESRTESFYWYGLTSIPAWINNYLRHKVWVESIYPFPNFNSATVEVWEWISNFIPHFIMNAITFPWG